MIQAALGEAVGPLVGNVDPHSSSLRTPNPHNSVRIKRKIALGVADGKLDPTSGLPRGCHPTVAALAAMCCDPCPEMRPTFSLVAEELEVAIGELRAAAAAAAEAGSGSGVLGRMFSRR